MPIEAKSPFGDSDGPVPLPVWAKWGGHPGPAPSPLVGVRGPTWATTYFLHLVIPLLNFFKINLPLFSFQS